ncbi:MAG: glycosyltransferase family 2 protein [Flavobacteriales bacterium]|nr:glycosyltransferase family 2 protein [Flavobacteriales bacterium]MBK9287539.1 glycosyltransferase family 2 protein [Flavobacteriales bacterium]MBL0037299.1 glycosyltransferase family 2 protein [Flavobacteriales bacterium]
MRSLSAVIITFNEERNLGRCLASLKGVADDIVVLDSFSTDRTEAIAKEHGARFMQHAFDGHIEQKNRAITHALHPFILSLDADEALDDSLRKAVLQAKNGEADGYTMNRLTNYCGSWIRHGGWYPDVKLRLWDSRKGRWTGVNPHDRYELDAGSRIEHLPGDILHYSYYTLADHIRQVNYFTDIMAQANLERGKRSNLLRILFSPLVKFVGDYVFRLGFVDGYHGFVIAMVSAHATFLKYAKLRDLQRVRP